MAKREAKSKRPVPFPDLLAVLQRFSPIAQRDIKTLIGVRTRDNKKTVRPADLEGIIDKDSGLKTPTGSSCRSFWLESRSARQRSRRVR